MRKKSYTSEMLKNAVSSSLSLREVLGKLGLQNNGGGNYRSVKRHIKELSLDTSHFKGQKRTKGTRHSRSKPKYTLDALLVKQTPFRGASSHVRNRLIREGVISEWCHMDTCPLYRQKSPRWAGQPLTLHLDHINGDSRDYRLANLRLLCPNCHSQTKTYCGNKNRGMSRNYTDLELRNAVAEASTLVEVCEKVGLAKGSYHHLRSVLDYKGISTDHFKSPSVEPANKGRRKIPKEEFKRVVATSVSLKEIANKLNISTKTASQWIKGDELSTNHFARKKRGVPDKKFIVAVKNSNSVNEVCDKVGLARHNHSYIWKRIRKLGLDTSHFTNKRPRGNPQS